MSIAECGRGRAGIAALCTVQELREVKEYHVPAYQRGYRWQKEQVKNLLDDVWAFACKEGRGVEDYYCLQPLVVVPKAEGGYEVVDGQQRLTTLWLILRHLGDLGVAGVLPLYKLSHATRPGLKAYFNEGVEGSAGENIDLDHVRGAVSAIQEWFDQPGGDKARGEKLARTLLREVKVIWYVLPEGEIAVRAFSRLNAGKIELTDMELIRALFLRREREDEAGARDEEALRLRIAQEWDGMEKVLQNDRMWYFVHPHKDRPDGRIGLIFDLVAGREGVRTEEKRATFAWFAQKLDSGQARQEMWRRVRSMGLRLEEWFGDDDLFHLVGGLVHGGMPLLEVMKLQDEVTKPEFRKSLRRSAVLRALGENAGGQAAWQAGGEALKSWISQQVQTLAYGTNRPGLVRVLLLFNLATLLTHRKSNVRFQFDRFKKDSWDLEHVRSNAGDDLDTLAKQQAWLMESRSFLESEGSAPSLQEAQELCEEVREHEVTVAKLVPASTRVLLTRVGDFLDSQESERKKLLADIIAFLELKAPPQDEAKFTDLKEWVLDYFGEDSDADDPLWQGMGNLVLLDMGTNRRYGNTIFPKKRETVLGLDRAGVFVPPCTRNVFLKCYSPNVGHVLRWTRDDATNYQKEMIQVLTNFATGEMNS